MIRGVPLILPRTAATSSRVRTTGRRRCSLARTMSVIQGTSFLRTSL